MTFGVSRDDAEGKFLLRYVEDKILPRNPFETLDRDGIGRLMKFAVDEGRAVRPSLSVGICGEHGGDADSIALCEELDSTTSPARRSAFPPRAWRPRMPAVTGRARPLSDRRAPFLARSRQRRATDELVGRVGSGIRRGGRRSRPAGRMTFTRSVATLH